MIKIQNIPQELKKCKNWLLWGHRKTNHVDVRDSDGKLMKMPCQVNYDSAKSNDSTTWTTFENVIHAYKKGDFNGIGVVIPDGYFCIDIDERITPAGDLPSIAVEIMEHFNTYTEITPSKGIHIWGKGMPLKCGKVGKIECYGTDKNGRKSNRYITVTGERLGTGSQIKKSDDGLEWLYEHFFLKKNVKQIRKNVKSLPLQSDTVKLMPAAATNIETLLTDENLGIQGNRNNALFQNVIKAKDILFQQITRKFLNVSTLPHEEANKTIASALGIQYQNDTKFIKITDKKKSLVSEGMAREVLLNEYFLEIDKLRYDVETGEWYKKNSNIWKKVASINSFIDKIITNALPSGIGFSASWLQGVCLLLRNTQEYIFPQPARYLLPFKNGVLNMGNNELESHEKHNNFRWALPHEFSIVNTKKPVFTKFIRELTTQVAERQILRAYMYAILLGMTELEKYLVLVGLGGTGKGTFIRLCSKLVGKGNFSTTSFTRMKNSTARFELGSFYLKRLIMIPDSEFFIQDPTILKTLTGEDYIPYEAKGKNNRFDFKIAGMLLIASNEPLQFGNNDYAVLRRMIQIRCDHITSKPDLYLEKKLAEELPGIINWVLSLGRDNTIKILMNTDSIGNNARESLVTTTPIAQWCHEYIAYKKDSKCYIGSVKIHRIAKNVGGFEDGPSTQVSFNEVQELHKLYPHFYDFCQIGAIKPLSLQKFSRVLLGFLKTMGISATKGRDGGGAFINNIELTDNNKLNKPSVVSQKYSGVMPEDKIFYNDDLD